MKSTIQVMSFNSLNFCHCKVPIKPKHCYFFKLLTYFFLSLQTHWLTNHWLWTWDHFWGGINTINGPSTWKLCFLSFKPLHIRVCFDLLVPSQVFCPVRLIETMNMANSCISFQIVSICLHSWNLSFCY